MQIWNSFRCRKTQEMLVLCASSPATQRNAIKKTGPRRRGSGIATTASPRRTGRTDGGRSDDQNKHFTGKNYNTQTVLCSVVDVYYLY